MPIGGITWVQVLDVAVDVSLVSAAAELAEHVAAVVGGRDVATFPHGKA